jgi:hypothetical protein
MLGLLEACEGVPADMTLGIILRVSPSSLDIFFQSERLTLYIKKAFICTAPLFALAFEGALLPLSMQEPALSPLLALPKRIEPRTEYRGIHLLLWKERCKVTTFSCYQQVKERQTALI